MPSKIKEIIKKYNFPENYNFIEETKPTIHIKDQGSCSSCWAFASTTALSYRYHKLGIEVDLSPQYLLSCYFKSCEVGDHQINTQFALVSYGTVTEDCFPYSSAEGKTIEEYPSKCKNGEEIKKYYAKNAYSTQLEYSKENYYDIVTIIMDQLINYGPVVSSIKCYGDFDNLFDVENCYNYIYKYDEISDYTGKHAVVIVGYGYEKSKFYWLIQNSWGKDFCNNGFAKVEFSEIGIEKVGFSEPYIPKNDDTSNNDEISAKFTLNGDCRLKYETGIDDNEKSFAILFQNVKDSNSQFYYQCNFAHIKNKSEGICNYNYNAIKNPRGYYEYYYYNSLNNENEINLNFSSLPKNQFYYYGADYIDSINNENYYISEEGSGILLLYSPYAKEIQISRIYPNKNSSTALSNCKFIPVNFKEDYYLIYCQIKEYEIIYFENNANMPLSYDALCGNKEPMNAFVHKLDKTKHPVFRVEYLVLPDELFIKYKSELIIVANIEGNISEIKDDENVFVSLINIKKNKENYIDYLYCYIKNPLKKQNNFEIYCYFSSKTLELFLIRPDNIYLTPYYYIVESKSPFEIIIKNNITSIKYEDYYGNPISFRRGHSKIIKASFCLYFILFLLF